MPPKILGFIWRRPRTPHLAQGNTASDLSVSGWASPDWQQYPDPVKLLQEPQIKPPAQSASRWQWPSPSSQGQSSEQHSWRAWGGLQFSWHVALLWRPPGQKEGWDILLSSQARWWAMLAYLWSLPRSCNASRFFNNSSKYSYPQRSIPLHKCSLKQCQWEHSVQYCDE